MVNQTLSNYKKFHFDQLPKNEQLIYKKIYNGWKEMVPDIDLGVLSPGVEKRLSQITDAVYDDNPEFFYIDISCYGHSKKAEHTILKPFYIYDTGQECIADKDKIKTYHEKLELAAKIVQEVCEPFKENQWKCINVVYEYITKECHYEKAVTDGKKGYPASYTIVGPLLKREAVCHGYSLAFKYLCDKLEIPSIVVTGGTNGKLKGHAWNIVRINENNYHLDITWDLSHEGRERDDFTARQYRFLSDDAMKKDHNWIASHYPKCTSNDLDYFHMAASIDDIKNLVISSLKKGKRVVTFRYINRLNQINIDTVEKIIKKERSYKGNLRRIRQNTGNGCFQIELN